MKTLIVIPARYGSTRFPGKPLHDIRGKTLLQRVANVAQQVANGDDIVYTVATDHDDILRHCGQLGIPAVMTGEAENGSERALQAAKLSGFAPEFVINLQGDVPFADPSHVRALIEGAAKQDGDVFTPVVPLTWEALDDLRARKAREPFSGTTCVRSADGKAFWFSKQILPAIRKENDLREEGAISPVFRHIGLYGYRLPALERFCSLPVGMYELHEGLEQLRFLENGMVVRALVVEPAKISMSGVDSPADAVRAGELIDRFGDPFKELV